MKATPITLEVLTDTLAGLTVIETINTSNLVNHTINHPIFGDCQTIQSGGKCLLIRSL